MSERIESPESAAIDALILAYYEIEHPGEAASKGRNVKAAILNALYRLGVNYEAVRDSSRAA